MQAMNLSAHRRAQMEKERREREARELCEGAKFKPPPSARLIGLEFTKTRAEIR
jgi:hypothetical protein